MAVAEVHIHLPINTVTDLAHRAIGLCSPNPRVGCVLVKDGQVIGQGHTQSVGQAHAEVVALRDAQQREMDTVGATAYVTLEPCSMCAGLIVHSRIARVVYGALEPKAGIVQSQGQFFTQGFLNHRVLYEGGVLAEECGAILSEFFKARRAR